MELVSILIPCHNNEEHVGTAIESALGQTWPACEVIVVDDGSTDGSPAVARRYETEGVNVIVQENRGAPAARNRALQAAEGEYIQYLDADDLLHAEKVEAQVEVLRDSPPGCVAVTPTCYFDDGEDPDAGRVSRGDPSLINSDDPVQWLINLWTPGRGWGMVQTGAWLTPRSVAEKAGPWDEQVTRDQDGEYFTRVLLESNGVRYAEDEWVYYRKYPEGSSVSSRTSESGLRGWLRAIDSKRDHLLSRTADEQREQAAHGLARQYWSLALDAYPAHPDLAARAEERAASLGHPDPLRSISKNGWKGVVAQSLRSLIGWRAARWCQTQYHRVRKELL
ncbi:glycosyltransferase family 2 protein [Salinibacter sp.]|uniref:glycosyltransferase family 2 protein n=1 Tax=Salinibacter sp. TaxID=2065818 RepID=UPI0021E791DB|nr:glycosyltransferase family A protein [Salinibacter sp.]